MTFGAGGRRLVRRRLEPEDAAAECAVRDYRRCTGVVCISGDIVIARPPEVVFDVLADGRNEPAFNPRMLRAEKVTPGPIGPGTRFRTTVRTRGGTAEMTVEYTTVDRPWQLASTSTMPSARVVGRLALEPVPEGTRLWWSWDLRPVGRTRLLGPVLSALGNRQERRIWAQLKNQLEAAPDSQSALVYR